MQVLSSSRHLLSDFNVQNFFRSSYFLCTGLFAAGAWLIDPLIDSIVFGEGDFMQQLLNPQPFELYIRTAWCLSILIPGSVATIALMRVQTQHRQLQAEQELLSRIIDSEPECVKTVAQDGTLLSMNPAGLKIVEADQFQDVQGASVYDLIAPEDRQRYIAFNARIFAGQSEQTEYDVIGLKGTRKTVESHAVPLLDDNDKVKAHLAITRDITEAKRLGEQLSYQASHDMLTDLINRNEFERRVNSCLTRSASDNSHHAVLFLDLDQFKLINDTCGHLAGDQLLRQLGELLRSQVRQQDSVARMGGDEFAILLEYCSLKEAKILAHKLRHAIDAFQFPWDNRTFKVTASIGLVAITPTSAGVMEILRDADAACYVAKDRGRNRIQVYQLDDEATSRQQGEMQWVSKIHDGIREERFCLFAQIIEGLNPANPEQHAEILLRYREQSGELAPPGAFLPAAERYGIAAKLDRYVVDKTLEQLTDDPSLLARVTTYSINLSGHSIADEDFLAFVMTQFKCHPHLATHICFEITETAAISHLATATQFISCLKTLGCRFSLDDFGSGLSSFGYLKNLPVDYVKIDGDFVRDIMTDPIHLAMVRSINDIGHLMGKGTIAEFVESEAIKQELARVGIDFAQGYAVGKPRPLAQLTAVEAV